VVKRTPTTLSKSSSNGRNKLFVDVIFSSSNATNGVVVVTSATNGIVVAITSSTSILHVITNVSQRNPSPYVKQG